MITAKQMAQLSDALVDINALSGLLSGVGLAINTVSIENPQGDVIGVFEYEDDEFQYRDAGLGAPR